MSKFYIYRHIRLDSNTPFYVGKGTGYRFRDLRRRNIVHKRINKKHGCKIEIVKYFDNETEAFNLEKILIKLYKSLGYCEANLADGGLGVSGCTPWNKGKKGIYSKETLEKISEAGKGRKLSEESKKKMRETHSKRDCSHSEETKRKMSICAFDKKMSDESRKKMSTSKRGLHAGSLNGMFKYKCEVDGILYESIKALADELGINRKVVDYRCRTNISKWKTWRFINV